MVETKVESGGGKEEEEWRGAGVGRGGRRERRRAHLDGVKSCGFEVRSEEDCEGSALHRTGHSRGQEEPGSGMRGDERMEGCLQKEANVQIGERLRGGSGGQGGARYLGGVFVVEDGEAEVVEE
eukprot:2300442-Rhodomonas_salina.1